MVSLLSITTCHLGAVVAVGDGIVSGVTFQFSIGDAIYNAESTQMWTTSADDLSAVDESIQKYGLAYTPFISPDNSGGSASLVAYPSITLDAVISQSAGTVISTTSGTNPILGKAFSALTLVGANPAVVVSGELNSIYYLQQTTFSDGAKGLNSADGTSIINKFDYVTGQQVHAMAGVGAANLVAARATGAFGSTDSHLSFVQLIPGSFNGASYSCLQEQASEVVAVSTPVLIAGTSNLAALGTSVAMYPSGNGLGMYVGLDVTAANTAITDRAVGLFTVTGVNSVTGGDPGSLTYTSVIADVVVQEAIATPISCLRNEQIAVRNVSTGYTSTGLGYIFVARDNGAGGAQSIYAMPMITMPTTNENFGQIGAFDSVETVFKISGVTYRTQGFSEPIAAASEINIAGSAAVTKRILVGGGAVPDADGYIEQLSVQGDSVYITIQEPFATGTTPGMFKSDALFDETGRIMAWTRWQRVSGSQDQMLFAIKNRGTSATMFVSGASSNTIQQTTWNGTGDFEALVTKTSSYLPKPQGGAQGMIPFPSTTAGFTALPTSQVSLVALTGNSNVIIAQTGHLDIPTQTFQILTQTTDTSIVLDDSLGLDIGSVVTAAFGNNGAGDNWLFMGGDSGLSVLSHVNGTGFVTLPNSAAAASLIDGDQTCKMLGNFTFVKKIVNDGNYIYVMTNDAVYRFLPLSTKFTETSPAALDIVQVISASQLNQYAYCLDMLVDNGVILLGTTSGLYSINVQGGVPGVVTPILIPGGLPAISKIQTISSVADYSSFYALSNLYVLSIDFATEQARLNRFVVVDGVATPIEDQLLAGQNGPLVIFDYMSNNMFIDGTLGFMTSYRINKQPPVIKYLQYTLQAGISGRHFNLSNATTNISIAPVLNSLGITGIERDFASGSLLMAADFGLLADS
jgi:hypothetical protein